MSERKRPWDSSTSCSEQEADHPDIVMTIVTNSDDYPQLQVIVEAESTVSAGDQAIRTA
jgi:hypothetical protein